MSKRKIKSAQSASIFEKSIQKGIMFRCQQDFEHLPFIGSDMKFFHIISTSHHVFDKIKKSDENIQFLFSPKIEISAVRLYDWSPHTLFTQQNPHLSAFILKNTDVI